MLGTYKWRCHAASTLTDDHFFYTSGLDFDDSKHQELQHLIDNHPDCKSKYKILNIENFLLCFVN